MRIEPVPEPEIVKTLVLTMQDQGKSEKERLEAREKLILGHTKVGLVVTRSLLRKTMGHDPQDVFQESLLGVTEAVDRIANGRCKHTDYTAYIGSVTKGFVFRFLGKDHVVPTDWRSKESTTMVDVSSIDSEAVNTCEMPKPLDWLSQIIEDDTDKLILELKLDGMGNFEIAGRVGMTHQAISCRIQALRNRLRRII